MFLSERNGHRQERLGIVKTDPSHFTALLLWGKAPAVLNQSSTFLAYIHQWPLWPPDSLLMHQVYDPSLTDTHRCFGVRKRRPGGRLCLTVLFLSVTITLDQLSAAPVTHISMSRSLVIYHQCSLIRAREAWSGFHQSSGRRGLTLDLPCSPSLCDSMMDYRR